ncbi:unnamed protein product [Trichobilharzia szidati]|nr:unnamed protein product [Trichobilharzia szidati]
MYHCHHNHNRHRHHHQLVVNTKLDSLLHFIMDDVYHCQKTPVNSSSAASTSSSSTSSWSTSSYSISSTHMPSTALDEMDKLKLKVDGSCDLKKPGDHSTQPPYSHMSPTSYHSPAPFWYEPAAIAANNACDYTIKITLEMAKSGQAPRPVRVYADGAYDMFHSGHARQLMQAKCAFPNTYLIVGVSNDADVHHYKGRTVMNEKERYEAIRHCRYVDEVINDAPWSITNDFLQKHKIDFVAHDDIPYASPDSEDVYKPLKDAGMFLVTQRTEGISTTDVIGRIVRDYDVYLRRNIRRGLSRKDLNISYMKEKSIRLQNNLETMMKRGSTFIQNFDSKRREFVDQLEDISHEVVRSFMRIFGSDGHLRHWWSSRKRAISNSTFSSPRTSPTCSGSDEDDDDDNESEQPYNKKPRKCYSMIYGPRSCSSSVTDSDEQTSERRTLSSTDEPHDDHLPSINDSRRQLITRQGLKNNESRLRRNSYRSLRSTGRSESFLKKK